MYDFKNRNYIYCKNTLFCPFRKILVSKSHQNLKQKCNIFWRNLLVLFSKRLIYRNKNNDSRCYYGKNGLPIDFVIAFYGKVTQYQPKNNNANYIEWSEFSFFHNLTSVNKVPLQ